MHITGGMRYFFQRTIKLLIYLENTLKYKYFLFNFIRISCGGARPFLRPTPWHVVVRFSSLSVLKPHYLIVYNLTSVCSREDYYRRHSGHCNKRNGGSSQQNNVRHTVFINYTLFIINNCQSTRQAVVPYSRDKARHHRNTWSNKRHWNTIF